MKHECLFNLIYEENGTNIVKRENRPNLYIPVTKFSVRKQKDSYEQGTP